jgi:non-ribosomal peptide synthetase component F
VAEAKGNTTPSTLVDLFARTVGRHPGAVAVSDGAQRLTYAELADRSDRLAAGLVALGVAPEDRVVLHLPATVDSVMAILGVVKAGAAGLPVDADAPTSDVDAVISTGGVRLVLIGPGRDEPPVSEPAPRPGPRPGPGPGPQTVDWLSAMAAAGPSPAGAGVPGGRGGKRPASWQPAAGNAACVLPARGRDGELRHVVLEHRQLVPLALDPVLPPLRPGDRAASATSVAAAEAQVEIWRALAGGAEVVVLPPDQRSSSGLVAALRRRKVSVLSTPAVEVDRLVGLAPSTGSGQTAVLSDALASLRVLHATGIGLHPDTVRALRAASFTGRLLTRFGPVETSTTAAVHELSGEPDSTEVAPLGRPPAGVHLYVLDEELRPVPAGMPGELYVGGTVVGRGYLDRPERTVDRFLPDPFSSGGRMYPTGELVTRGADGTTRYLGPAEPDDP